MRILITEPLGYPAEARAILASVVELTYGPFGRTELLRAVSDCDGLLVRLAHKIDNEVMAHGPRLNFVATATTGLTHIDLAEAERRGIAILSLRGQRSFLDTITSTAEHAFGLLLMLSRNICGAVEATRRGEWNRDAFRGHQLYGRTIAIIGFGRLGRMMAGYAHAFHMNVVATDPYVNDYPTGVLALSLEAALERADVVSLHASFDPGQSPILFGKHFERMKRGALLVNTARGELIDEVALLDALRSGHLGGAALDVLAHENDVAREGRVANDVAAFARSSSRLLLTPHIGGATIEAMERTDIFMAQQIVAHLTAVR